MKELWRPVVGHENSYEVSNLGRVRSKDVSIRQKSRWGTLYTLNRKGKLLRPGKASNGYFTVAVGRGNSRTVHSLVAEAFIGPCPEGMEVLHIDGTRDNNRADNLRYGTRSENNIDASKHGRRKITVEDVKFIRGKSTPQKEMAKKLGISESYVRAIVHRKVWDHV